MKSIIVVLFLMGLSLASTGCTDALLAEMATLSGAYAGDVVAAATTQFLQQVWNVEDAETEDAAALHDHEH